MEGNSFLLYFQKIYMHHIFTLQEGQKINLTIHDYTQYTGQTRCHIYAVARQTAFPRETRICAGQALEHHLMVTQGHVVDIEMKISDFAESNGHIVLEYQGKRLEYTF